jgi:uncharacterized membrane protein
MSPHRLRVTIVAIALIVVHGAVLYYVSSHVAASAAVISGVGLLMMAKHAGLIGVLHAWWRRRTRSA